MVAQKLDDLDTHKRKEYLKVKTRSLFAGLLGHSREVLKQEIEELKVSLNDYLKVKA
jgi:hypothetical protein